MTKGRYPKLYNQKSALSWEHSKLPIIFYLEHIDAII